MYIDLAVNREVVYLLYLKIVNFGDEIFTIKLELQ